MTEEHRHYDILIAGQGAAAYSAGLYAARYQTDAVIVGGMFGGETAIGGIIENYPGTPDIDGFDLMMKFREQVEKYEVPIIDENVASVRRTEDCFEATTDSGQVFQATSIVLAVGRERRKLGLEHEEEWIGRGVSFCSTCDAPLHRDNTVVVVGGGNAAVEGAILISKYADKVYLVYRQDKFTRPEPVNIERLDATPNVIQVMSTNVLELKGGDNGLDSVVFDNNVNGSNEIKVDGIFIEIGADPRKELAEQLGVSVNDIDELVVDKHMNTNVKGVYAAGDLTDGSGELKQTVTAAAQGAIAATSAYNYIATHPHSCPWHAKVLPAKI